MIIKSNQLSIFNLLHLLLRSTKLHQAESSINIFALDNLSIAFHIFQNSSSCNSHFANFHESISIAEDIILSVNCSLLISKLNIATFFQLNHIFCAIFKANAVFHIEGLAAKITISQPFNHHILLSKLLNHN